MSVHTGVDLRCDHVATIDGDHIGCPERILARTGVLARREARTNGWATSTPGGKDYCPDHRGGVPTGSAGAA